MKENIADVPIVYPLVSIQLRTVAMADGRRIQNECEEVVNFKDIDTDSILKLFADFTNYVEQVISTASTNAVALQNILDTHSREKSNAPGDLPSSLGLSTQGAQGTVAPDPGVAGLPDKASL